MRETKGGVLTPKKEKAGDYIKKLQSATKIVSPQTLVTIHGLIFTATDEYLDSDPTGHTGVAIIARNEEERQILTIAKLANKWDHATWGAICNHEDFYAATFKEHNSIQDWNISLKNRLEILKAEEHEIIRDEGKIFEVKYYRWRLRWVLKFNNKSEFFARTRQQTINKKS